MSGVTMPATYNGLGLFDEECLITDIAYELSAKLEDASQAPESLSFFDSDVDFVLKQDDNEKHVNFDDELTLLKCNQSNVQPACDISVKQEDVSSDGSEVQWMVKNALDTPPITPPRDGTSPDNFVVVSSPNDLITVPLRFGSLNTQPKPAPLLIKPKPEPAGLFEFCQTNSKERKRADFKIISLPAEEIQREQARRKQERMIRNRESAYLSRKRKKEHMQELEKKVEVLTAENNRLKMENSTLKEQLSKYQNVWSRNFIKGKGGHKKTTAFVALLVTICLNISSFSGVIDMRSRDDSLEVPVVDNSYFPNRISRTLLWTSIDDSLNTSITCPISINETESIRLESELRRWIEGDEPTRSRAFDNRSNILPSKLPRKKHLRLKRRFKWDTKQLDLYFKQRFNFDSLYEAIHRRDDTFYLVSFSPDHLLLPALARNQTSRPKMSLMLPAFFSNSSSGISSDKVEMMQIDCEVTNTQLLSVNEDDIPTHLRHFPKYSNDSVKAHDKVPVEVVKLPEPENQTKSTETYKFLKHLATGYKNLTYDPESNSHKYNGSN